MARIGPNWAFSEAKHATEAKTHSPNALQDPSEPSQGSFGYLTVGPSRFGLNFTNPYPHAPADSIRQKNYIQSFVGLWGTPD